MEYSRHCTFSSEASLLDSVHKQTLVRSCGSGQHEVLIYEGDYLPGTENYGGVRVTHRHTDQLSANPSSCQ